MTNIDLAAKVNPYLIFQNNGFFQNYCNQSHEDNILVSEKENIFNLNCSF